MRPSSLLSRASSAAALVLAIGACAPLPDDRPTTPEPAPRAIATARSAVVPRLAPISIVFDQIDGAEAARARAVFAPVERRVVECHQGGGVVRLRLVSHGRGARYSIEPETTLDGHARRCVLETLSTLEFEGISGDPSPLARPSGFSALIRIEW